jgi:hypothetical protein
LRLRSKTVNSSLKSPGEKQHGIDKSHDNYTIERNTK